MLQLNIIQNLLNETYPLVLSKFRNDVHHPRVIVFEHIFIQKPHRGQGLGRKYMESLIKLADEHQLVITMSPSDVFGSDITRLKRFYTSLGFEQDTQTLRKFSSLEKMIRINK